MVQVHYTSLVSCFKNYGHQYFFFLDVHFTTAIYMVLNFFFFFFACLLHWMGQRNLRYFISQLFRIPPFSCLGPILSRVGFRTPPLPTLPKKKNSGPYILLLLSKHLRKKYIGVHNSKNSLPNLCNQKCTCTTIHTLLFFW